MKSLGRFLYMVSSAAQVEESGRQFSEQQQKLKNRRVKVRHKRAVTSGKGVGESTVTPAM
jgi:hypothetical protein